jgi:hypothetical protein
MQANMKQDMKNHENPTGANRMGYLLRYILWLFQKNMPYI